jgi:polyisoprenoid-binding protein YceI
MTTLSKIVFAALVAATSLSAQETALQIDPAQTEVGFTLADVLHTVHGKFMLKSGTIRFDPATGKASGELVVDAASGESGSPARDRRMHQNILESAKYPEIVFRPDRVSGKVEHQGTSQVELHGAFLIHGQPHDVVIPVQVEGSGDRYAVTGHFTVPYVRWGMKNPSTLILRVSDKVDIDIKTVARPPANTAENH